MIKEFATWHSLCVEAKDNYSTWAAKREVGFLYKTWSAPGRTCIELPYLGTPGDAFDLLNGLEIESTGLTGRVELAAHVDVLLHRKFDGDLAWVDTVRLYRARAEAAEAKVAHLRAEVERLSRGRSEDGSHGET